MKKTVCFFLALTLLLALPVSAAADEIIWQLSGDGQLLYQDDTEYKIYPIPAGERFAPAELLIYEDAVEHPYQEDTLEVGVLGTTDEIIAINSYFYRTDALNVVTDFVYVTEKGMELLDAYTAGEFAAWYVYAPEADTIASTDRNFVKQLDLAAQQSQTTVSASYLGLWECYEILGADETGSFLHTHGMIFRLPEGDYYVNCDALDNSFFSANGTLSYRRGSVPAAKLSDSLAQAVQTALASAEPVERPKLTYYYVEEPVENADDTFVVCSVILGIVLPLVPFVAGIVLSFSKKSLKPKRWLTLTALAAVWMALMGVIAYLVL